MQPPQMELPDPTPPKKTILDDPDLPLIDASDEKYARW